MAMRRSNAHLLELVATELARTPESSETSSHPHDADRTSVTSEVLERVSNTEGGDGTAADLADLTSP